MSNETLSTKIALLENNHQNLMDRLDEFQADNKQAQQNIIKSLEDFHSKTNISLKDMSEKLDKALEKKAGIWVEGVIRWVGIIIGAGIIGYVGSLFVKLIEL